MEDTDSNFVIADGVKLQHTQEVRDHLNLKETDLHPLLCSPHNRQDGYPPYSHPCMILDHGAFAPYQREVSKYCKEFYIRDSDDGKLVYLFDHLENIWETDKYIDICCQAINNHAYTMQAIMLNEGDIKGIK